MLFQLINVEPSHATEIIDLGRYAGGRALSIHRQPDNTDATSRMATLSIAGPDESEVRCLALNIYFEARSEPESGQLAVGHVVMNRVAHRDYPDTVCNVVQQGGERVLHRCQFSWWCDGRSDKPLNRPAWAQALRLARDIYVGVSKDTTDGALWYHATYVAPYWSELLQKGDKIGRHIFYLENQRTREAL